MKKTPFYHDRAGIPCENASQYRFVPEDIRHHASKTLFLLRFLFVERVRVNDRDELVQQKNGEQKKRYRDGYGRVIEKAATADAAK